MKWYIKALKNYVNFEGRARRKEFWMFTLINSLIILGLYGLLAAFAIGGALSVDQTGDIENQTVPTFLMVGFIFGYSLIGIYSLAVFLPSLALAVRRLHDTGKSGWMYLIGLVPLVGAIILIVFFATDGDIGDNEYGPDPKAISDVDEYDYLTV